MNNQHLDYKSDNANYQIMENELYLKDYVIITSYSFKKNNNDFFDCFQFRSLFNI